MGIRNATNAMYNEMFDTTADGLYKQHGGKKGDRNTLPRDVQEDIIVGEIVSRRKVDRHDVQSSDQEGVNDELTDVVRDASQETRSWLGRLFGG